jgi:uncharacterized membrane protein
MTVMCQDSLLCLGFFEVSYPYIFHAVLGVLIGLYWDAPRRLMKSMMLTRDRAKDKEAKDKAKAQAGAPAASP